MVQAVWNGTVIAESDETIMVEGNHYFPPSAVKQEFLRPSTSKTTCHWKGEASYHDVEVDGEKNPDAAWFYPEAMPEAKRLGIEGYIAFWHGVKIS